MQLKLRTTMHGDPHEPGDIQTPGSWLELSSVWTGAELSNMAATSPTGPRRLAAWPARAETCHQPRTPTRFLRLRTEKTVKHLIDNVLKHRLHVEMAYGAK